MIRCPNCNRTHPNSVITCDCGFDLQAYDEEVEAEKEEHRISIRPYQILPILLIVLRGIGGLSVLGGAFYAFSLYAADESFWYVFGALMGGILAGIPYFALSEALTVLLDMSQKQDKVLSTLEELKKR